MAKFTSTAASKRAKAAPTPQRSVPDIQLVPEQELDLVPKFGQWVVNAVGGKSPQTSPARFGGLIGQMSLPSARQAGVLQQLQQSYGNSYVGQVIQAKLTVGHSTDVYEQEANRVADAVMRMPEPDISPSALVSYRIQPLQIQRMCTECWEEEEERIHPKEAPGQTPTVTPALEAHLNATSGSGQPLPEGTRTFMESRFGHDFSQVRLHTDADAAQMNRELKAQAFTRQRDIYFGSSKYQPDSREGQRLLAHELTHVIQQSGGVKHIQRDVSIHNAGCPLEMLDVSSNSAQIGAMCGAPNAYGLTRVTIRIPGRKTVLGRMIAPNRGEIWCDHVTSFSIAEIRIYLTNQFANGSCEYSWVFEHELRHWLGGCRIFERSLSLLQSDLQALPDSNNRQIINDNQPAVEQARQNLAARVDTILRCFRIEVCREISRFNHDLDSRTYPQAFNSCPQPHPQVPQVPPLDRYLATCNLPPIGCPREIR